MGTLLSHEDAGECILQRAPDLAPRLVCVNRALRALLTDRARQHAHRLLRQLSTESSIFSVTRDWRQFGELYRIGRGRSVLRRLGGGQWAVIRRHCFGFYTGRRNMWQQWHQCTLEVPSYASGRPARLRVETFDIDLEDIVVTRTLDGIRSVGELAYLLDSRHWHSSLCIESDDWSYVSNTARQGLVVWRDE